jgi:hypothetical protein
MAETKDKINFLNPILNNVMKQIDEADNERLWALLDEWQKTSKLSAEQIEGAVDFVSYITK